MSDLNNLVNAGDLMAGGQPANSQMFIKNGYISRSTLEVVRNIMNGYISEPEAFNICVDCDIYDGMNEFQISERIQQMWEGLITQIGRNRGSKNWTDEFKLIMLLGGWNELYTLQAVLSCGQDPEPVVVREGIKLSLGVRSANTNPVGGNPNNPYVDYENEQFMRRFNSLLSEMGDPRNSDLSVAEEMHYVLRDALYYVYRKAGYNGYDQNTWAANLYNAIVSQFQSMPDISQSVSSLTRIASMVRNNQNVSCSREWFNFYYNHIKQFVDWIVNNRI